MDLFWLENLELELEKRLDAFLSTHPYQESLIEKIEEKDLYESLLSKQINLQSKAQETREELLELAKEIKNWITKAELAQKARDNNLRDLASTQINQLMKQGKDLWGELDAMGVKFRSIDLQIQYLKSKKKITQDWQALEIETELEQLRKKK